MEQLKERHKGKATIKRVYFILVLISLSFIITDCSTDDNPLKKLPEEDLKTQRIYNLNSKDTPIKRKELNEFLNKSYNSKNWLFSKGANSQDIRVGNEVIENSLPGYKSYSIELQDPNREKGTFKNLLIEKTETKEAAYLITFTPSKEYINAILLGGKDIDYKGDINVELLSFKDKELAGRGTRIICNRVSYAGRKCASGAHDYGDKCSLKGDQRAKPKQSYFICIDIGITSPPIPTVPFPIPGNGGGTPIDRGSNPFPGGGEGDHASGDRDRKDLKPKYRCLNADCTEVEAIDPIIFTPAIARDFSDLYGEEDFVEAIITEGIQDEPSLMDIYNKLGRVEGIQKILDGFRNEIISDSYKFGPVFLPRVADLFFEYNNNFDKTYKEYEGKVMAITELNKKDMSFSHVKVNIIFNTDRNSLTSIYKYPKIIAITSFIHEIMHAEMYKYLWENMKEFDKFDLNQLLRDKKQGKIFDMFNHYYYHEKKKLQHNIMSIKYRKIIKKTLREIYPKLTEEEADALSWIGLEETKAFDLKLKENPDFKKNRDAKIQEIYKKYPEFYYP